jgi:CheY-like chemotaxis protein
VVSASSAPEALEVLSKSMPALLISDIGMPGEDGSDLIRKVRALAPDACGRVPAVAFMSSPDPKTVNVRWLPDISSLSPSRLSHPSS